MLPGCGSPGVAAVGSQQTSAVQEMSNWRRTKRQTGKQAEENLVKKVKVEVVDLCVSDD